MSTLDFEVLTDVFYFVRSLTSSTNRDQSLSRRVPVWGDPSSSTGAVALAPGEMEGGYQGTCSLVLSTGFCNIASVAFMIYLFKSCVDYLLWILCEEDLVLYDDCSLPADENEYFCPDQRECVKTIQKYLPQKDLLCHPKTFLGSFANGLYNICGFTSKAKGKGALVAGNQEAARWFRQAKFDLEAAFNDYDAIIPAYDWVCQKCHQGSEKAIKAVLYAKGCPLTDKSTHDLVDLARAITEDKILQNQTKELQSSLGFLSFMRYPDALPYPKVPRDVIDEQKCRDTLMATHKLFAHIEKYYESCLTVSSSRPVPTSCRGHLLDASTQT